MDEFLSAYIECALWSSSDPDDNDRPLNETYCEGNIVPETLAAMKADCEKFIELTAGLISADEAEAAGHDFWLTRNGHGAGFWDGDWGDLGDQLTDLCKPFGERDLYVWEGKVYQS